MDPQNRPLSIILEETKQKFIQSFNEIQLQTKLPAYLTEGIIVEILSEIRNRKNFEILLDSQQSRHEDEGKDA